MVLGLVLVVLPVVGVGAGPEGERSRVRGLYLLYVAGGAVQFPGALPHWIPVRRVVLREPRRGTRHDLASLLQPRLRSRVVPTDLKPTLGHPTLNLSPDLPGGTHMPLPPILAPAPGLEILAGGLGSELDQIPGNGSLETVQVMQFMAGHGLRQGWGLGAA